MIRQTAALAACIAVLANGAAFAQSNLAQDVEQLESDLQAEIAGRQAADASLQANIDAEAAQRTAQDTSLAFQLDSEQQARIAGDQLLQADRIADVDAEEAARVAADLSLQANIDNEAAARTAGHQSLQANLDVEAAVRASQDASLTFQLDSEEQARIAGDQLLQLNLDSLQSQIDAISGPDAVVSGFAVVPNGTDTSTTTDIFVAGIDGLVLTDACAGLNDGGWAFSGNTVGDFLRVGTDSECISVKGIALPGGEIISCRPLLNNVSSGDTFCTVSGSE